MLAGLASSVSVIVNVRLPFSTNGAGTGGIGSSPSWLACRLSPPGYGAPSTVRSTVALGVKPLATMFMPSLSGPAGVSAVT